MTSLCFTNVRLCESDYELDGGAAADDDDDVHQVDLCKWGEQLQGLRQLRKLDLDFELSEADVLRLTTLTRLTRLQVAWWDEVPENAWQVVQQQLPWLQELNPDGWELRRDW